MAARTLDQIDAEILGKNTAVDKLKHELRELARERDQLLTAETTKARIEAMSPAEREAMKRALA